MGRLSRETKTGKIERHRNFMNHPWQSSPAHRVYFIEEIIPIGSDAGLHIDLFSKQRNENDATNEE
jgi:hypothetical protein